MLKIFHFWNILKELALLMNENQRNLRAALTTATSERGVPQQAIGVGLASPGEAGAVP
jgi:hypothetical protein